MRYAIIIVAAVVVVAMTVVVVGSALPVAHRAKGRATYPVRAADVFALITNVRAFPEWRPSVQKVEMLPSLDGHTQFREIGKNGSILYEFDSLSTDKLLVTRIVDRSLPFGGKWTYQMIPNGNSTTLQITEDGEVYNPVFRFVSRFVVGQTATIDQYLADVGRHFARSSARVSQPTSSLTR